MNEANISIRRRLFRTIIGATAAVALGANGRRGLRTAGVLAATTLATLAGMVNAGAAPGEFRLPYPAGQAYTITQAAASDFSHNDDYNRHAIDIGTPSGTPVLASAPGTIYFEGWNGGGGIMALVDHGNNRCTQYAHLSSTIINIGDQVGQGQQIGTSGATGNVTGAHLHWNVINCDSQTSREIPDSVEVGTNYVVGSAPVSQNG
jgi:murein DD-endopeptidase MepM/ murein hydrolase activator NlpD